MYFNIFTSLFDVNFSTVEKKLYELFLVFLYMIENSSHLKVILHKSFKNSIADLPVNF